MFALKIIAYADLGEALVRFAPSHVVSLMKTVVVVESGPHLQIVVDDVAMPSEGYLHPTQAHLDQLLAFTADLTDHDRLLMHCNQGISRAPAAAIAVLLQHGLSYVEAFALVASLRPILLPNRLLIHLIDRHFTLGGALEQHVRAFYHRQGFAWRVAYRLHGTAWRETLGR